MHPFMSKILVSAFFMRIFLEKIYKTPTNDYAAVYLQRVTILSPTIVCL